MRPLRPIRARQTPEVEALRRRWRDAVDDYHADRSNPALAARETAAWRAYRDAAYVTIFPERSAR
jgi:hypothetical protein